MCASESCVSCATSVSVLDLMRCVCVLDFTQMTDEALTIKFACCGPHTKTEVVTAVDLSQPNQSQIKQKAPLSSAAAPTRGNPVV